MEIETILNNPSFSEYKIFDYRIKDQLILQQHRMKLNEPYLITVLNDKKIIFFVISYDEKKDYKIIKNILINSEGIQNGRIIDIEL